MRQNSSDNANQTVKTFAWASFLHDMGSDIVFSVWPLYVTTVLGANMTVLGLIDGLGDAIVSISQAVSGYFSDKLRKRKIFVWLGYLFGGLSRIGYAIAPSWQFLLPFRILDRSGKIRGSPRDAIVSEVSIKENRGSNFGLLRTMDNLGAVVGILIAIFFVNLIGYRMLFLFAALPSVAAVLAIIFFVKEPPPKLMVFKGITFSSFSRNLKLYTLSSALFALGNFSYSFLLVFAQKNGFRPGVIPVLYLVFTVIATVFSLPFGKLADAWNRKAILFISLVLWSGVLILCLYFQNVIGIIFVFILYGLHKAAFDPVQKTLVAELAPSEYIASTLGGFQMIIGLVSLPASFIAGIFWDRFGISVPFYFSLFVTTVSFMVLLFVKEK